MTTFDNREKGFETKFAHDEELMFMALSRRNHLLGVWAAKQLGKNAKDIEAYARSLVSEAVGHSHKDGDAAITSRLMKDFSHGKIAMTEKEIHKEMMSLLAAAKEQIIGENK